ncbi:endonuclease [Mesohalobacter halotolerans]|uniref:T9SS type A sorting domain-containing protein n=1 Tax=Mesohalobacter halotolerans TaxID=1883405 RepID=A0A4U5TUM0_9FLAO|nr:endonuclease [Mesohalobacter halotolerans]MBS3739221.1 endonuclease [Psychroflexus sp.]TKS57641.1 T9SS type A sorting domain-containing protein [Mesohalobacter halotolerans]
MKGIFTTFFILSYILAYAQAPQGYYDNAQGLTGFQLKTALKTIIDDIDDGNGQPVHNPQPYSDLDLAYPIPNSGFIDTYGDYDNDGFLLDIYSENPNGSDPYNHEMVTDECGNYNAEGVCYNKEHLLPQSFFNQQSPMRGDIHYVFPTDGQVNGYRSNFPFGEVNNPNLTTLNGSKRGPNVFPGYSGTVFEPLDEFKGDIARGLFYFATRYEDQVNSSGWDDPSGNVLNSDSSQFYDDWYIDLLLNWHLSDPVSQEELDRNENGFTFQNNRNPFIDNPIWVQAIWDENFSNEEFQNYDIQLYPNPVRGQFLNIKIKGVSDLKVEVYNIFGKKILSKKLNDSNTQISVEQWSSGIYLLKLSNKNVKETFKVIVP